VHAGHSLVQLSRRDADRCCGRGEAEIMLARIAARDVAPDFVEGAHHGSKSGGSGREQRFRLTLQRSAKLERTVNPFTPRRSDWGHLGSR
jgi:hypothetical protein